jgi:hypothetical protein
LPAAQFRLFADALDPGNPDLDAVIGKIGLQALEALGLARSLMCGLDLDFQAGVRQ